MVYSVFLPLLERLSDFRSVAVPLLKRLHSRVCPSGFLACVLWAVVPAMTSAPAFALSLGEAEALSEIGQPFRARIPFRLAPGESLEASCIRARGMRPDSADEFQAITRAVPRIESGATTPYIVLESPEASAEPIILLSLEIQCDKVTRLKREFVLLLDFPDVSAKVAAKAPEPAVQVPQSATPPTAAVRAPDPPIAQRPVPVAIALPPPATAPAPAAETPRRAVTQRSPVAGAAQPRVQRGQRDFLKLDSGPDDIASDGGIRVFGLRMAGALAERGEPASELERERLRREFSERMGEEDVYTRLLALRDQVGVMSREVKAALDAQQVAEARLKSEADSARNAAIAAYVALGLLILLAAAWMWRQYSRRDRFALDVDGQSDADAPDLQEPSPVAVPEGADRHGPASAPLPPLSQSSVTDHKPSSSQAVPVLPMSAPATPAFVPAPEKAKVAEAPSASIEYQPYDHTVILSASPLKSSAPDATLSERQREAAARARAFDEAMLEYQRNAAAKATAATSTTSTTAATTATASAAAVEKAGPGKSGKSVEAAPNAIDFDLGLPEVNPDTADFDLPPASDYIGVTSVDIDPTAGPSIAAENDAVRDAALEILRDLPQDSPLEFTLDPPADAFVLPLDDAQQAQEPAMAFDIGAVHADSPVRVGINPDQPPADVDPQAAAVRALQYRNDYVTERFPEIAAGSIALDKPATVIDGARTIYQEDMDVSRAIGLLQVASAMHPHDSYWLALLEIYWLEGMHAEFSDLAMQFMETFSRRHKQWPMIAKLGRGLDSKNALFAAEGLPDVPELTPNWLDTQLDMMGHVLARELRVQVMEGDETDGVKKPLGN